jgi:hypothetical protein
MEDLSWLFKEEIKSFFRGDLESPIYNEKGKTWIVKHGNMDTLTVEPKDGGQYEIAFRVPYPDGFLENDKPNNQDKFRGYTAGEGYLHGYNMNGH